jgi:hypothetical protein
MLIASQTAQTASEPVPRRSGFKKTASVEKRCAESLHAFLESTSKHNEVSSFGSSVPSSRLSQRLDDKANVQLLNMSNQNEALQCPTPVRAPASEPVPRRSGSLANKKFSSVERRRAQALHDFLESTSMQDEASSVGGAVPCSQHSQCMDDKAIVQLHDLNNQNEALRCPPPARAPASEPVPMRSGSLANKKKLSSVERKRAQALHDFLETK